MWASRFSSLHTYSIENWDDIARETCSDFILNVSSYHTFTLLCHVLVKRKAFFTESDEDEEYEDDDDDEEEQELPALRHWPRGTPDTEEARNASATGSLAVMLPDDVSMDQYGVEDLIEEEGVPSSSEA